MARIKYYYDTETCKYERIKVSRWDVFLNSLGFLAVSLIMGIGLLMAYNAYFDSPKEAALKKENEELKLYYDLMNNELEDLKDMIAVLEDRDDDVYRIIMEAEPIPSSVRNSGFGGTDRYKNLLEKNLMQEDLILSSMKKIELMKKQMYIQTKSYDEIIDLANKKSLMLASLPAIQPVSNKELKRLSSGFGRRIDPVYKIWKNHTGVDFSAERGTPIYATGDGTIVKVKTNIGGYGKEIEIDHGFGYVTKYAHMQDFNVRVGQKVKRGDCIGFVGSTGKSTAPHLHYEVIKNGVKVNPVYYFFQDITEEEYEKLLELSSIENQSLG
ncbi:M23 family metallopeptidase [Cytophagales bacterium LB-30]|uniref:M23 family metallopeptidase n=1 Tax=Shiella aurantiaca TaxID=3058365 RepID=A0ABT8F276_9BACT|nr:M23 family metallopeptidase [Shiella aurantiaca]MDN4164399.1 M23 family metallopeptidase [Shiella aurantiaca]